MIKIEFVLPGTQGKFSLTESLISTASVNTVWNEEYADGIIVTCGAIAYSCKDGSCIVVTPAGTTKLKDLWPTVAETPVTEPASISIEPVAQPIPPLQTP
jgi:hypothetical protein